MEIPPHTHGAEVAGREMDVNSLYRQRFAGEQERKEAVWRVLCRHFFQRFVPREASVKKSALPQHPLLVYLYLKLPLAWRVLGAQSFLVMEKGGA